MPPEPLLVVSGGIALCKLFKTVEAQHSGRSCSQNLFDGCTCASDTLRRQRRRIPPEQLVKKGGFRDAD